MNLQYTDYFFSFFHSIYLLYISIQEGHKVVSVNVVIIKYLETSKSFYGFFLPTRTRCFYYRFNFLVHFLLKYIFHCES